MNSLTDKQYHLQGWKSELLENTANFNVCQSFLEHRVQASKKVMSPWGG